MISTKLNVSELTNDGEQAGLVLWQSEGTNNNNFAKIVYINKGASRALRVRLDRNSGQDIQNSARSSRSTRPRSTCG